MFRLFVLVTVCISASFQQGYDPQTNVCNLPMDVGPCDGLFPRYYYDKNTGICTLFNYGGCEGNANNFLTFNDCRRACGGKNVCHLPKDVGPCDFVVPRYYYNSRTGLCTFFIYGGCEGNANNFLTLDDCRRTCEWRNEDRDK